MWQKIIEVVKKVGGILLMSFVAFFMFLWFGELGVTEDPINCLALIAECGYEDEYGYTDADDELSIEQLIEYYGGQKAFIFDEEYGVYLYLELDDELHYIIDDSVSDAYVALFDKAIAYYNALGFITITYERGNTELLEDAEFYYAVFELEFFEDDFADAMAFNEIAWDEDGNIFYSVIYLSTEILDLYEEEVLIALLVHEIGHTFGLKDIYDYDFEDDSIMFYIDSELTPATFTEFDLFNLQFKYLEDYILAD
jgi:hypothetical protein